MRGGQRTVCGSLLSPSAVWVLELNPGHLSRKHAFFSSFAYIVNIVSLLFVLCPSCRHQSYGFYASCLVFIFFLCVFTPMRYSCHCLFSPFYLVLGIKYNFEYAVWMLCSELCSQPIQRLLDALHTAHLTQASTVPELNEQKKFLENSQPISIQVEPAGAAWCWKPFPAHFPTEPQQRETVKVLWPPHYKSGHSHML